MKVSTNSFIANRLRLGRLLWNPKAAAMRWRRVRGFTAPVLDLYVIQGPERLKVVLLGNELAGKASTGYFKREK